MEDWTIAEDFELPSSGKVYAKQIESKIKLRSMTTEEEMKRLGHSPYVYKMFSDMIDSCIVNKEEVKTSVYDMCLGDYQYLLYKLRTVTYGPEYVVQSICPFCGKTNTISVNLDNLKVNRYKQSLEKALEIQLPRSKKLIKLKWQTPRMLDEIEKLTREQNKNSADNIDSAILFNVMSLIDTIDGEAFDDTKKEIFVRKLPMADTNMIIQTAKKYMKSIGIDTTITHTCADCKNEYQLALPITGEFFGPAEN